MWMWWGLLLNNTMYHGFSKTSTGISIIKCIHAHQAKFNWQNIIIKKKIYILLRLAIQMYCYCCHSAGNICKFPNCYVRFVTRCNCCDMSSYYYRLVYEMLLHGNVMMEFICRRKNTNWLVCNSKHCIRLQK